MSTLATVQSVIRAIRLTREDQERATARFNGDSRAYLTKINSDYAVYTMASPNFKAFLNAAERVEGVGFSGRMIIWVNLWTVMELEMLETGHSPLREFIINMTSCNPQSLKAFAGSDSKAITRCFKYLELLFND